MRTDLFLVISALLSVGTFVTASVQPEQVHIAITSNSDEVIVQWFTQDKPSGDASVKFGISTELNQQTSNAAKSSPYTSGNWSGFSHSVILTGLTADTEYWYQCGTNEGWSAVFTFHTLALNKPFSLVWFGDMGVTDMANDTIMTIAQMADKGEVDIVMHVGDIAYCDFDHEHQGLQETWSEFMNLIEPASTRIPYMTCPGNHDVFYDIKPYFTTFRMPQPFNKELFNKGYYELSVNNVHFIALTVEHEILIPMSEQWLWLEDRLANYEKNLKKDYPWLIIFSHRPFWCSNAWSWCSSDNEKDIMRDSLALLFDKYKVDVYVGGHTHSYERSHMIHNTNGKIADSSAGEEGTLHLVVGMPGAQEGLDMNWMQPQPEWSAFRDSEIGFGRMTVHNDTHLQWQFVRSVEHDVYDEYWLVK